MSGTDTRFAVLRFTGNLDGATARTDTDSGWSVEDTTTGARRFLRLPAVWAPQRSARETFDFRRTRALAVVQGLNSFGEPPPGTGGLAGIT